MAFYQARVETLALASRSRAGIPATGSMLAGQVDVRCNSPHRNKLVRDFTSVATTVTQVTEVSAGLRSLGPSNIAVPPRASGSKRGADFTRAGHAGDFFHGCGTPPSRSGNSPAERLDAIGLSRRDARSNSYCRPDPGIRAPRWTPE
jgi:hypothetical protein